MYEEVLGYAASLLLVVDGPRNLIFFILFFKHIMKFAEEIKCNILTIFAI